MRPHYSQSSRENETPLASHKELGLWNSEHMQLKESGPAPLYPETKNTRSTENDWNPKKLESRRNPRRGILGGNK